MARRKSKSSIYMTFRWFYKNLAFILGLTSQTQLNHRITKRRSYRKINQSRSNKYTQTYERQHCLTNDANQSSNMKIDNFCRTSQLTNIYNNNNRTVDNSINDQRNSNQSMDNDQQRILCIHVENKNEINLIEKFFVEHAHILKNSHIIDLQEFIEFKPTQIAQEDATTMTNIDRRCNQLTSCVSLLSRTENVRRLKALEYIRMFIEMNKEDFFNYLVNEEQLCSQKISVIYQIIKQFLIDVYQSEYAQKQS